MEDKKAWAVITTANMHIDTPKIYVTKEKAYEAVDDWYQFTMDKYATDPDTFILNADNVGAYAYIHLANNYVGTCQAFEVTLP